MVSEARKRANKKYMNDIDKVKVFQIRFFPSDHKLYEKLMEKGKSYVKYVKNENGETKMKSGVSEYVRDLIKRDLGMLGESEVKAEDLKSNEMDGE